jgi:ribonuclease-3
MRAELAMLEAALDYRFASPDLLRRALTHSSAAHEAQMVSGPGDQDNERMEFLGDSILGFLTSEALVERHPECREGDLSRLRAHLVSAAHLYGVACSLDLGRYLELGRSEEMSGGRGKKTLLVDALEALIAAIYLDGGIEPVRNFVATRVLDAPPPGEGVMNEDVQASLTNFKSALQEFAQSRKLPQPRYAIVEERGPEHSKTFTVEVRVGKEWSGRGEGASKKIAAQKAAQKVYQRLREQPPEITPNLAN